MVVVAVQEALLEAELDGDDYDSADFTKPLFLAKARSEAEDVSVTRAI